MPAGVPLRRRPADGYFVTLTGQWNIGNASACRCYQINCRSQRKKSRAGRSTDAVFLEITPCLVQAAEQPDQRQQRQRHADNPQ
jgi:hypothetical protein